MFKTREISCFVYIIQGCTKYLTVGNTKTKQVLVLQEMCALQITGQNYQKRMVQKCFLSCNPPNTF